MKLGGGGGGLSSAGTKAGMIEGERPASGVLDLGLLKRLFTFTRPYAKSRNILFVLVIVRGMQLPILAWMVGAIIDSTVANKDLPMLFWSAGAYIVFAAFTDITFCFRMRLALNLGESVIRDLRIKIYDHLLNMRMGYFHRYSLGRSISRFTTDAEAVRMGVQDVLFVTLVQGGQMIGAAVLMAIYDPILFLIVLGLVPILWVLNHHFRKRLSTAHREVQESYSRVTSSIAEAVNGIRVTQGFVRGDLNTSLFHSLAQDHAEQNMKLARTTGFFIPLLEFNSQLFIAILIFFGGYQVLYLDHGIQVGELIMFFFLANLFFSPIQNLGNQYNNALNALAGAERLFNFLDLKPDWEEPDNVKDLPPIQGRVEFDRVKFSYNEDRPALKGVSFTAEPGQTIALVGHTGSGKSTIINLLSKFYLPDEGRVLIDGHDMTEIAGASLYRQLGMVQQQNLLFSGTVLTNILFAKPGATREDVHEVIEALGCRELFEALPEGLDTPVGEKGGGLSLGQRQLVCFARAMLADPRILILDEATSSIDAMTELVLQEALTRLLANRTSFLVAHRLSTIRRADLIMVLQQGEIIERGNHENLLKQDGTYAQLYRQFVQATTEPPKG